MYSSSDSFYYICKVVQPSALSNSNHLQLLEKKAAELWGVSTVAGHYKVPSSVPSTRKEVGGDAGEKKREGQNKTCTG